MDRIRVTLGDVTVTATLSDSRTSSLLRDALPFESSAQRWGDEVYFQAPVETGEEDPQPNVPDGAVAYWPPGKALCLFFGQQPYSPVNVVGLLEGDYAALADVKDGTPIRVESA